MSNFIHQRIEDNLKELLPLAQQADEILQTLSQDNKAKFSAIFPKHNLFKCASKQFLPYLEELDQDLKALPQIQDPAFEPLLTDLMKKIEVTNQVLASFHEIRDDEKADSK